MRKLVSLRSTAAVALLLSCLPTDPCACPPATTRALVYGWVRTSAGNPSPSASVRLDVSPDTGCAVLRAPLAFAEATGVTGSVGTFRLQAISGDRPRHHCVQVTAFRGQPGMSDSARVGGLIVYFRAEQERPDSLGVVLTLP